ncbi:interleukin-6 receptor subunit alpha [Monodelphis domestica]|uniref:Interleukin 6 receptor n=1 Tax=Monodelphis domestica TaxID=13616 RepID=F6Z3Z1_MONDO|nr:interleukin-6 receptor subunit alpha [Monodelphis domestica]SBV08760.1 Interleukin-6 receptor alpha [Monodelphis domestica]
MLSATLGLLAVLFLAFGDGLVPEDCPRLDVPRDILTQVPGAPITLTCLNEELKNNATIRWTLEDKPIGPQLGQREMVGGKLLLRSVQYSDSGNYTCYVNGSLVRTLPLLVVDPPEEPVLSCHWKSFVSRIQCEWSPQRKPSPQTEAVLLVRHVQKEAMFQKPCQYLQGSQKFSCPFHLRQEDDSLYLVVLCVTNGVMRKVSKAQQFRGYEVLQPDPPTNITVTAVDKKPHRLNVTWKDPPSWNSTYYRLQFELRYRAEKTKDFTKIMSKDQHSLIISDAWMGKRHVVQIRAQEEFSLGKWSEWSQEVTGTPWTETKTTTVGTELFISTQAPTTRENCIESLSPENPEGITNTLPGPDSPHSSYTFLVAGGSLVLGTILFIGIIMRYRKKSKLTALKEGKPNVLPPFSLGQLVSEKPQSTPVLVPLISPSVSPSSSEPTNAPGHSRKDIVDPPSPYDVTNRDYFFFQK